MAASASDVNMRLAMMCPQGISEALLLVGGELIAGTELLHDARKHERRRTSGREPPGHHDAGDADQHHDPASQLRTPIEAKLRR